MIVVRKEGKGYVVVNHVSRISYLCKSKAEADSKVAELQGEKPVSKKPVKNPAKKTASKKTAAVKAVKTSSTQKKKK